MPITASMSRHHKPRSGIAVGGIGAGWFELRHDGCPTNWNIFNNQPLGTAPRFEWTPHSLLFFVVRWQEEGQAPKMRLLQIEESHRAAAIEKHEYHYIFPWLSGVDRIDYEASFPFTRLRFDDRELPVDVELECYSPFIPHDAKNSSLPAAIFRFKLRARRDRPVDVTLIASQRNCVAYDIPNHGHASRFVRGAGFQAFEQTSLGVEADHDTMGTMGVGSLDASDGGESSHYLGWEHIHPYYERTLRAKDLANIDDTMGRNRVDQATGKVTGGMERCFSSIARSWRFEHRGQEERHRFAAAWCFPNLRAQEEHRAGEAGYLEDAASMGAGGSAAATAKKPRKARIEGHYYSNFFKDSTEVIAYLAANEASLHERSLAFHRAFFRSDAPTWLLDQVNSQLNTFIASSWHTKAGDFGILEGLSPEQSFAGLGTTDVAMYGAVAAAALFPELDRRMILAHRRFQHERGSVIHSIAKNFVDVHPGEASATRLDMPAQYAYMALRSAFWSGDRAFLEQIWPSVQAALEYVLRERDQNRDLLPDMEGVMCSYDNFPMYGVAPYVASQWLSAARCAQEAARILGDAKAEARWREVVEKGSATLESAAWNGRYYRLYNEPEGRGADEGCLTDQIIGRWAGDLVGLPILDGERAKSALRSVLAINYKADQGLRNCQWPGDGFLHDVDQHCWVDQANTCWTGVELPFASFLIYEGLLDEGLMVARNVDERHRDWGMYWDHQEFGGHYYRPMGAWAIVNALLGLTIRDGEYGFAPKVAGDPLTLFFAFAGGWGHFRRGGRFVSIEVGSGELTARAIALDRIGKVERVSVDGRELPNGAWKAGGARIEFAQPITARREILIVS